MRNEKDLENYLDKITQNKIQELRKTREIDNYLFNNLEKKIKKLAFPYFRFEIMHRCITDIKNNHKKYPQIDINRINIIHEKLENICIYLNTALDEYNNMLSYIEKCK